MTTGAVVLVVVAVVVVVVAVAALVLRAWRDDRRDHRRYLAQCNRWGPDGVRAGGDAWAPIAGDGPPAMRLRVRGLDAQTGLRTGPDQPRTYRAPDDQ